MHPQLLVDQQVSTEQVYQDHHEALLSLEGSDTE